MAAIVNARDVLLQAAGTRLLPVQLPSNYTTTGDHVGTLDGSAQTNFQNSQITLSSNGTLQNAGGGQVTNGASIGNLNASNITTGTLAASLIAASSITSDKLSVSTLSAIAANLGTVTAGFIFGSADIEITGRGIFKGAYSSGGVNASVHANGSLAATYGVSGGSSNGSGAGVFGTGYSGANGVRGVGADSSSIGVSAVNALGGTALAVAGKMTITSATKVTNLYADRAATADSVAGANVTGTVASAANAANATNASNSSSLNGIASSGWCRFLVTDSGTATASSTGFVLTATVSGVRTRATGGRNVVIESFSDEELKFDIKPEMLGLNFLMKLTPITYQVKHNPGITYHGLGARAMEKILQREKDSLCVTHDDGVKGIDYNSMIGVLIKAVQELNEKVNELEIQLTEGNL